MPPKCQQCGSNSVVSESHFTQEQFVCTNCGSVASEGSFQYDESTPSVASFAPSYPKTVRCHGERKPGTPVQKLARTRLRDLAIALRFTPVMVQEAEELFDRICKSATFRGLSETKKLCIVGNSVYIVARQQNWCVTTTFVANYINVPIHVLLQVLKRIIGVFGFKVPIISFEDMVPSFLKDLKMAVDEAARVEPVVYKLVKACKKLLVAEGIHSVPFLTAVTYVAACSTTKPPRFVPFKNFCLRIGVNYSSVSRLRLNEVLTLLMEMCKEIPWNSGRSVTRKTVVLFVADILKYSDALLALRENDKSEEDLRTTVTASRHRALNSMDVSQHDKGDAGAARMTLEEMCSTELTEKDVGDNELSQYIRSPKEIEYVIKLQNNMK